MSTVRYFLRKFRERLANMPELTIGVGGITVRFAMPEPAERECALQRKANR